MKKKFVITSVVSILVVVALYVAVEFVYSSGGSDNDYCPFCDKKVIDYQKYYENDAVIGLCSHRPISKGHCLIIPKRHVERFENLSQEEELAIAGLIKKTHKAAIEVMNADSYILLQKNGKNVGQTVSHLHVHYIPRKAGDRLVFGFLLKFAINPFRPTISQKEMNSITSSFAEKIM